MGCGSSKGAGTGNNPGAKSHADYDEKGRPIRHADSFKVPQGTTITITRMGLFVLGGMFIVVHACMWTGRVRAHMPAACECVHRVRIGTCRTVMHAMSARGASVCIVYAWVPV